MSVTEDSLVRLAKLREPFLEHQISIKCQPYKKDSTKGKCAKCGGYHGLPAVALPYVGHAALTDRLLEVDPLWEWKPLAKDVSGLPLIDANGGMWIELTVCGVTRLGYGDADGKTGGNAMKERIGDALRNAAMRFGAALDLWHKGDLHPDEDDDKKLDGNGQTDANQPQPEGKKEPGQWAVKDQETFSDLADRFYSAFKAAGKLDIHPAEAEKWRGRMATTTAENLLHDFAKVVEALEGTIKKTAS